MTKNTNLIGKKVKAMELLEGMDSFPQVGEFEDKKALQNFYKQLDTELLEEWVAMEGLEFTPSPDSEPIHRMRVCMAILYHHYPRQSKAKKKSKYSDYSLEDLIGMAMENDVAVPITDDARIMRMRTIMALREAGHIG